MPDLLTEVLARGGKGSAVGAVFGFVLGSVVTLANSFLFVQEKPLYYKDRRGRAITFRFSEQLAIYKIEDDLKILFKYRKYDDVKYDCASRNTQLMMDLYDTFKAKRDLGEDAVKYIAKFRAAAIKADGQWRDFFYTIQESGDAIALEEAKTAAMQLHVTYETVLSNMRGEFEINEQMASLPVPNK
jgi:hypothetical protein